MSYLSMEERDRLGAENTLLQNKAKALLGLDDARMQRLAKSLEVDVIVAAATVIVDRLPLVDVVSAKMILLASSRLRMDNDYEPRPLSAREEAAKEFWINQSGIAVKAADVKFTIPKIPLGHALVGQFTMEDFNQYKLGRELFDLLKAGDIHGDLRDEAERASRRYIEDNYEDVLWLICHAKDPKHITNNMSHEFLATCTYEQLAKLYKAVKPIYYRENEQCQVVPTLLACIEKTWKEGVECIPMQMAQAQYTRLPKESNQKLEGLRKALALAKTRQEVTALVEAMGIDTEQYDFKDEKRLIEEKLDELLFLEIQKKIAEGRAVPHACDISSAQRPRAHKILWDKERAIVRQQNLVRLEEAKKAGYEAVSAMDRNDIDEILSEWQDVLLALATTPERIIDLLDRVHNDRKVAAFELARTMSLSFEQRCYLYDKVSHETDLAEKSGKLFDELLIAVGDDPEKAALLFEATGCYQNPLKGEAERNEAAFKKLVDCLVKARQKTKLKELFLHRKRDNKNRIVILRGLISICACLDDVKDLKLTFNHGNGYDDNAFSSAEWTEYRSALLKYLVPDAVTN